METLREGHFECLLIFLNVQLCFENMSPTFPANVSTFSEIIPFKGIVSSHVKTMKFWIV